MVAEIRFYFEGAPVLKEGFDAFLDEIKHQAREKKWQFRLIAAKGRPVDAFETARKAHPSAWNVLLLDSDKPDDGRLCEDRGLDKAVRDSVFWMVEIMEAWFLADPDALRGFYGQHFQQTAVQCNPDVEQVPKRDVYDKLMAATRNTDHRYDKTADAPELLRLINPAKVRGRSRNCERMFRSLLARLA